MDRKTFIIVNGLNPGEGLLSVIDTVLEEDLIRVESEESNEDLSIRQRVLRNKEQRRSIKDITQVRNTSSRSLD